MVCTGRVAAGYLIVQMGGFMGAWVQGSSFNVKSSEAELHGLSCSHAVLCQPPVIAFGVDVLSPRQKGFWIRDFALGLRVQDQIKPES